MIWRAVASAFIGLFLCAQTPMLPGFPPGLFQNRAALDASGAAPPSIDGSAANTVVTGTTLTLTLTTTQPNDVIIAYVLSNDGSFAAQGVSSIADVAGLTWAQRAAAAGNNIVEWWAVAPSPLTGDVITITFPAATTFSSGVAFGVSGANTAAPFDTNVALPALSVGAADASISTTATSTFCYAGYRQNATASPTAGAGWTQISGINFMLVEYKIVTSAQSGLLATSGTGGADRGGGVGDAIKP